MATAAAGAARNQRDKRGLTPSLSAISSTQFT